VTEGYAVGVLLKRVSHLQSIEVLLCALVQRDCAAAWDIFIAWALSWRKERDVTKVFTVKL
jgi:hypothetical protein